MQNLLMRINFSFLLCIIAFSSYSNRSSLFDVIPNSVLDFGVGVGMNYGIFGTKTIIGYKGSGLLIGVGYAGMLTYEIGGQLSYKNLYLNLEYGVFGTKKYSSGSKKRYYSAAVFGGWKFGLGESKKLFLDVGVGYVFNDVNISVTPTWSSSSVTTYSLRSQTTGVLGLTYRIPSSGASRGKSGDSWYVD